MTKKDYLIIAFTLFLVAIHLSEWQISFDSVVYNKVYRLICTLGFIVPLMYVFIRARDFDRVPKLIARSLAISLNLVFWVFVFIESNAIYPSKSQYLMLYVHPENSSEFVEITHHHTGVQSWNSMRQVVDYRHWGFQLEKYIEQDELKGTWIIQTENPYHDITGIYELEDGKVNLKGER